MPHNEEYIFEKISLMMVNVKNGTMKVVNSYHQHLFQTQSLGFQHVKIVKNVTRSVHYRADVGGCDTCYTRFVSKKNDFSSKYRQMPLFYMVITWRNFMFTTFMVSFFIFTVTKWIFSKIHFSLSGKKLLYPCYLYI